MAETDSINSQDSLSLQFHRILQNLPADVSSFVALSKSYPKKLFENNTLQQLLVVLLNEPDIRISNKATKLQILEIFINVAKSSRVNRIQLRLILQSNHEWFTDDVEYDTKYEGEIVPERDLLLIKLTKTVFSICWKIEPNLLKSIIDNPELSIESSKVRIIQEYAVIVMQSIIRSHQARIKLYNSLKKQAEEQELEIRDWSILILQKVARGYIARKTVLRSMQIRKTLSKEVLRITERYLKKGDLWGFLKEINDELDRSNQVIIENQTREDNWASNFVEKVIHQRQSQFDETWERFPKALSKFTGKATSAASLIDQQQSQYSNIHNNIGSKSSLINDKIHLLSNNQISSTISKTIAQTHKNLITPKEVALAINHNDATLSRISSDTNDAANHLSIPGPLMRKALSNSLNVAVADQLNKLVNNEYRSKQLVKNFRDVYEPTISSTQDSSTKTSKSSKLKPIDNNKQVIEAVKHMTKKKKRLGLDGKPIIDIGKINATQSNWMNSNFIDSSANQENTSQSIGESLLLDIPNGLDDNIERLMHAAALRCYVPDFFKGVAPLEIDEENNLLDDNLDEEVYAARAKLRKARMKANPNIDPSYAYQMYLKLPMGLAKMRYELQCKKWSQGSINKLRVKGLNYLSDVFPLSKFIMCMKSVDTPILLMNTCVDLYLELRSIGKTALMGKIDKKSLSKLARSTNINMKISSTGSEGNNSMIRINSPNDVIKTNCLGIELQEDNYSTNTSTEQDDKSYIDKESSSTVEFKAPNNEIPSKILLSMIEDQEKSSWCDLKSPIENIFLHAAFLIVPYTRTIEDNSGKIKTKHKRTTRIESNMGNFAFKLYTEELLKLTTAEEKREAIKERFRACFILTTPFTLFLKNKHIYTVGDLLKVNLSDLALPKALEVQLEVLLVVVVSKCVDAKIIPVPRDHLSTAEELFTVPMFYDPKFQRSPFDPYGRPPRLQPIGNNKKIIQKKLKSEEKMKSQVLRAHLNLNKVASVHSIEEDLDIPVNIWTSSDQQAALDVDISTFDADSIVEKDSKWSFCEESNEYTADYFHSLNQSTIKSQIKSFQQDQTKMMNNNNSHSVPIQKKTNINNNNNRLIEENQEDYLTQSITKNVFKNTYTCTHAHCNQVFSRLYTYKIHLKSHDLFGQYHDFKRKPQLYLDKDRQQIDKTNKFQYEQSINLSQTIQSELKFISSK